MKNAEKPNTNEKELPKERQKQAHAQAQARACCFVLMRSTGFKPPEPPQR
jgi:hypothetical protein